MSYTRAAQPGELCTCGRQAVEVFTTSRFGEIGHCGPIVGAAGSALDSVAAVPATSSSTASTATAVPEPIMWGEFAEEYAKIAPNDTSATPAKVNQAAGNICKALRTNSSTPAQLIETATEEYGPDATAVLLLLTRYKCPGLSYQFR
jgi:hypothetical protein